MIPGVRVPVKAGNIPQTFFDGAGVAAYAFTFLIQELRLHRAPGRRYRAVHQS